MPCLHPVHMTLDMYSSIVQSMQEVGSDTDTYSLHISHTQTKTTSNTVLYSSIHGKEG